VKLVLRVIATLLLFALIATWLGSTSSTGLVVLVVTGLVVGGAVAMLRSQATKTDRLLAVPFEGELPAVLRAAVQKAPLLVGDLSYGKRVIAADSYPHNWQELAELMQFETSGRAEVLVDLVLQPTHPTEQYAIAVTLGGLVIGYVPRVEAVQLYEFVHKLGGAAKVNANVYFDPIGGKNRVEIDWTLPLATNDMFKPDRMRYFGGDSI
jgi:hypothetical protein